ncbi:hypothetical protein [Micromonospora sp. b486]|nr:hypothetical protein [Micromonospora sp. b486]MDM4784435.1 hypothetical protein [Micromonospora sp. b486]
MTSTTPVTIDALKAARELAPTIADRAAEGERLGCVPPDLLDRISRPG